MILDSTARGETHWDLDGLPRLARHKHRSKRRAGVAGEGGWESYCQHWNKRGGFDTITKAKTLRPDIFSVPVCWKPKGMVLRPNQDHSFANLHPWSSSDLIGIEYDGKPMDSGPSNIEDS